MKSLFDGQLLTVERLNSKKKFEGDNISFESEEYRVETGGFFLNEDECLKEYECKDIIDLVLKLYVDGTPLPTVLHGAYYAIVYDKNNKELHVYNDLLSKHSLFYSYNKKTKSLVFSDSFFSVAENLKENHVSYTIDTLGVKMMLWHRMFYDDITYIREIKFLRPFDYLIVKEGKLEVRRIDRPGMLNISLKEAAKEIHQRFTKAVRLQYHKNQDNGYPQIIALSGGMDSRSTFLYGLANGYTNQKGFCYGESTSVDFKYAQRLATQNDCQLFFHAIDKGNHLLERDEMCKANEAQMVYSGASGAYDSLTFYDTHHWGIVHTGLGGGEIMGDMRVAENPSRKEQFVESLKYKLGKGKKDRSWESFFQSLRCTEEDRQRIEQFRQDYNDFNDFQSLNDMRRCLNGQKIAKSYGVEFVSPFLYEEFFCYLLRIPYSLTKDRALYIYWQKEYNSKQFDIPSTFQMGCRPGNVLGYYCKRFYQYAVNKFGKKTKHDMVPMEQWLSDNPKIEKTWKEWYDGDLDAIKKDIDNSTHQLFEKVWRNHEAPVPNILTATWALKNLFKKE